MVKKYKIVIYSISLFICLLGIGWVRWVKIDPNNAETVLAAIDQRGAHWIIADSMEYHEEWDIIMNNIARGHSSWLEVFTKLAPESDAHPAEDLSIALSKAIISNPLSVLKILNENSFSKWISYSCGTIDSHNDFADSSKLDFLQVQRDKVNSVNDSTLKDTKARCLEFIDLEMNKLKLKT